MTDRAVDQEERERAGVSRGQNVLHVLPQDAAELAQVLPPSLDRLDSDSTELQLVVVTPDVDTAIAAARVAAAHRSVNGGRVVPVTTASRAARLLRARPVVMIAGTPGDLMELVRGAVLKLDHVKVVVFAWADALLDTGAESALEALMTDIPREAARVIVTSELREDVETLVERYARRPRREGIGAADSADALPLDLQFVSSSAAARSAALRRLLDHLDPDSAAIYARSENAAGDVGAWLEVLGYGEERPSVKVTRGGEPIESPLLVLYDLPRSRAELDAMQPGRGRIVALVTPRQTGALRRLASGGRVLPLTLPGATGSARASEERARDEIRALLADGVPARELIALEPLLEEHDGVEIAAALFRLLTREREQPAATTSQGGGAGPRTSVAGGARESARGSSGPSGAAASAGAGGMSRLFINAGARDNVAPRDLVGAITGEAGISGDRLGKIEIRDNHSLVEVDSGMAEQVAESLTGITVRGRQIVARVDRDREGGAPSRGRPPREGSGGGFREGAREGGRGGSREGARGPRSDAPRGPRGDGPRGPRGEGPRGSRSEGPRGPRSDSPRPPRGDGPRGPGRGGPRDDRGGRFPSRDGGERRPSRGPRPDRP